MNHYRQQIDMALGVLLVGFALAVIVSFAKAYYVNYRSTDGWKLANGRIVGGDFFTFHFAGRKVHEDLASLYDFDVNYRHQQELLKSKGLQEGGLPFIYPPLMALVFSLFAPLSLLQAYALWVLLSLGLFGLGLSLVLKQLPLASNEKLALFVLSFAFAPFSVECLGGGQTSCIALFAFALVYFLLKKNRDYAAGLALGLSYYKPPLFLAFVILLLLRRQWRVLAGFATAAVVLTIATVLFIGGNEFIDYLVRASSYRYGEELVAGGKLPVHKAVGLFAFITDLMPGHPALAQVLFLGAGIAILGCVYFYTRHSYDHGNRGADQFDVTFGIDVVASLLLSLQMAVYDLTVMLVPMILVAPRVLAQRYTWATWLYLLAIAGLFCDFLWRAVSVGPVTVKITTLYLILWMVTAGLQLKQQSSATRTLQHA